MNDLLLGTVTDVSSAGVKILFDGHTAGTEKRYKQLVTGVALEVNDRIVVTKIAGSYVVLGKIAYNQSGGGAYVLKAGDTMTGDLVMDAADIVSKSETYTVGINPSQNYNDRHILFKDKLNTLFGRIQSVFMSDSRVGLQMVAERTVNNDLIQNILGIYVDENGNKRINADSESWRNALGTVLSASSAIAIPASGSSISKNMSGLTADYQLVQWNFSSSPENLPPVDLTCTTYSGYFTITNNGGTTSETVKPVFAIPIARTISNH